MTSFKILITIVILWSCHFFFSDILVPSTVPRMIVLHSLTFIDHWPQELQTHLSLRARQVLQMRAARRAKLVNSYWPSALSVCWEAVRTGGDCGKPANCREHAQFGRCLKCQEKLETWTCEPNTHIHWLHLAYKVPLAIFVLPRARYSMPLIRQIRTTRNASSQGGDSGRLWKVGV